MLIVTGTCCGSELNNACEFESAYGIFSKYFPCLKINDGVIIPCPANCYNVYINFTVKLIFQCYDTEKDIHDSRVHLCDSRVQAKISYDYNQ